MTAPRIGSLFAGYGGLDLGLTQTIGGTVAWHAEIDPAASRVLDHHWPDVPNLGDITAVDWADVESVDVLTGGFPCQDVSAAGRRAGLRDGTRSGLWSVMADAIDHLRPSLVVAENVRGLLSAAADSPVEPCPLCMGDGPGSGLRALGAVLGDLADIGYDAGWCGLRAADVGAPHGRFRVFIAAWPAPDAGCLRRNSGWVAASRQAPGGRSCGVASGRSGAPAPDAEVAGRQGRRLEPAGRAESPGVGGTTPDPEGIGRGEGRPEPARIVGGSDVAECGHAVAADSDGDGLEGRQERDLGPEAGQPAPPGGDAAGRVLAWGAYAPAVARWELILCRPAPAPTQTGKRGGQQLSPAFVEWMQGLPEGHVTDVPGLSRNDQLKLLGNGVVPQQATAALRHLLASTEERAA